MAESTANAVLVLSAGEPIEVQQTVEEIQALLAGSPSGNVSFFAVVDTRGNSHWVNAHEIIEFRELPDDA